MNRKHLEEQADMIERVLYGRRIQGRVWGGTVCPSCIRYDLTVALGTKIQDVLQLKGMVAQALQVEEVRMYREGGAIRVEVPRSITPLSLLALCAKTPTPSPVSTLLGIDAEGRPLILRLSSPSIGHVSIRAESQLTTPLLQSLGAGLALFNPQRCLQLAALGEGLTALNNIPHMIAPVASKRKDVFALKGRLLAELDRRRKEKRSRPHVVTLAAEVEGLLPLVKDGARYGLHVVAASDFPAPATLGEVGRGEFILKTMGEDLAFQPAFITEAEVAGLQLTMKRRTL